MKLTVAFIFVLSYFVGTKSYNWTCTEVEMGVRYIPSERNYHVPDTNISGTDENQLNIYPLPLCLKDDCYGDIVAIEYSYKCDTRPQPQTVFNWTLLILQHQDSEPRMFHIVDTIPLESRPENAKNCSQSSTTYRYCDCMNTRSTGLKLSRGFSYGVTGSRPGKSGKCNLLGFAHARPEYEVDTLQTVKGGLDLSVNANISQDMNSRTVTGLRMLWFAICKSVLVDIVYRCYFCG